MKRYIVQFESGTRKHSWLMAAMSEEDALAKTKVTAKNKGMKIRNMTVKAVKQKTKAKTVAKKNPVKKKRQVTVGTRGKKPKTFKALSGKFVLMLRHYKDHTKVGYWDGHIFDTELNQAKTYKTADSAVEAGNKVYSQVNIPSTYELYVKEINAGK